MLQHPKESTHNGQLHTLVNPCSRNMESYRKLDMKSPKRPAGPRSVTVAAALVSGSRSAIALRLGILIVSSAAAYAGLTLLSESYLGTENPAHHTNLASRLSILNSALVKGLSLGGAKARAGKRRSPLADSWRPSQSGAAWIPQPNKYLMAYCMRGQVSTLLDLLCALITTAPFSIASLSPA